MAYLSNGNWSLRPREDEAVFINFNTKTGVNQKVREYINLGSVMGTVMGDDFCKAVKMNYCFLRS